MSLREGVSLNRFSPTNSSRVANTVSVAPSAQIQAYGQKLRSFPFNDAISTDKVSNLNEGSISLRNKNDHSVLGTASKQGISRSNKVTPKKDHPVVTPDNISFDSVSVSRSNQSYSGVSRHLGETRVAQPHNTEISLSKTDGTAADQTSHGLLRNGSSFFLQKWRSLYSNDALGIRTLQRTRQIVHSTRQFLYNRKITQELYDAIETFYNSDGRRQTSPHNTLEIRRKRTVMMHMQAIFQSIPRFQQLLQHRRDRKQIHHISPTSSIHPFWLFLSITSLVPFSTGLYPLKKQSRLLPPVGDDNDLPRLLYYPSLSSQSTLPRRLLHPAVLTTQRLQYHTSSHLKRGVMLRHTLPSKGPVMLPRRGIYSARHMNPYKRSPGTVYMHPLLYKKMTGKPHITSPNSDITKFYNHNNNNDVRLEVHSLCDQYGVSFSLLEWAIRHSRGDVFVEAMRILIAHTLGFVKPNDQSFEPFDDFDNPPSPNDFTHNHSARYGFRKLETYAYVNIGINQSHLTALQFPLLAQIGKCRDPFIIEVMRIIRRHEIKSLEHFDQLLLESDVFLLSEQLNTKFVEELEQQKEILDIEVTLDTIFHGPEHLQKEFLDRERQKIAEEEKKHRLRVGYTPGANHQLIEDTLEKNLSPDELKRQLMNRNDGLLTSDSSSSTTTYASPQKKELMVLAPSRQEKLLRVTNPLSAQRDIGIVQDGSFTTPTVVEIDNDRFEMDGLNADQTMLAKYTKYNSEGYALPKKVIQHILLMKVYCDLIKDRMTTPERLKEWLHCTCDQPHANDRDVVLCLLKPLEEAMFTAVEFADSNLPSSIEQTRHIYKDSKYPQSMMYTHETMITDRANTRIEYYNATIGEICCDSILTLKSFVPRDYFLPWLNRGVVADLYLRGQYETAAHLLGYSPDNPSATKNSGYSWDVCDAVACFFVAYNNEDFIMTEILHQEGYTLDVVTNLLSMGGTMQKYDVRGNIRISQDISPLDLIHGLTQRLFATSNMTAMISFIQFLNVWSLDEFNAHFAIPIQPFNVAVRSSRVNEIMLRFLTFRDANIIANNYMGVEHNALFGIFSTHFIDPQRAIDKARFIVDYCRAIQQPPSTYSLTIAERDMFAFARAFAEGKGEMMVKDPHGFARIIARNQSEEEVQHAKELVLQYMNDPAFRDQLMQFRFAKLGYRPDVLRQHRSSREFLTPEDQERLGVAPYAPPSFDKNRYHPIYDEDGNEIPQDEHGTTTEEEMYDVTKPFWLRGVRNPHPYQEIEKKKKQLEKSLIEEAEKQLEYTGNIDDEVRELMYKHVPFHAIQTSVRLVRQLYGRSAQEVKKYPSPVEAHPRFQFARKKTGFQINSEMELSEMSWNEWNSDREKFVEQVSQRVVDIEEQDEYDLRMALEEKGADIGRYYGHKPVKPASYIKEDQYEAAKEAERAAVPFDVLLKQRQTEKAQQEIYGDDAINAQRLIQRQKDLDELKRLESEISLYDTFRSEVQDGTVAPDKDNMGTIDDNKSTQPSSEPELTEREQLENRLLNDPEYMETVLSMTPEEIQNDDDLRQYILGSRVIDQVAATDMEFEELMDGFDITKLNPGILEKLELFTDLETIDLELSDAEDIDTLKKYKSLIRLKRRRLRKYLKKNKEIYKIMSDGDRLIESAYIHKDKQRKRHLVSESRTRAREHVVQKIIDGKPLSFEDRKRLDYDPHDTKLWAELGKEEEQRTERLRQAIEEEKQVRQEMESTDRRITQNKYSLANLRRAGIKVGLDRFKVSDVEPDEAFFESEAEIDHQVNIVENQQFLRDLDPEQSMYEIGPDGTRRANLGDDLKQFKYVQRNKYDTDERVKFYDEKKMGIEHFDRDRIRRRKRKLLERQKMYGENIYQPDYVLATSSDEEIEREQKAKAQRDKQVAAEHAKDDDIVDPIEAQFVEHERTYDPYSKRDQLQQHRNREDERWITLNKHSSLVQSFIPQHELEKQEKMRKENPIEATILAEHSSDDQKPSLEEKSYKGGTLDNLLSDGDGPMESSKSKQRRSSTADGTQDDQSDKEGSEDASSRRNNDSKTASVEPQVFDASPDAQPHHDDQEKYQDGRPKVIQMHPVSVEHIADEDVVMPITSQSRRELFDSMTKGPYDAGMTLYEASVTRDIHREQRIRRKLQLQPDYTLEALLRDDNSSSEKHEDQLLQRLVHNSEDESQMVIPESSSDYTYTSTDASLSSDYTRSTIEIDPDAYGTLSSGAIVKQSTTTSASQHTANEIAELPDYDDTTVTKLASVKPRRVSPSKAAHHAGSVLDDSPAPAASHPTLADTFERYAKKLEESTPKARRRVATKPSSQASSSPPPTENFDTYLEREQNQLHSAAIAKEIEEYRKLFLPFSWNAMYFHSNLVEMLNFYDKTKFHASTDTFHPAETPVPTPTRQLRKMASPKGKRGTRGSSIVTSSNAVDDTPTPVAITDGDGDPSTTSPGRIPVNEDSIYLIKERLSSHRPGLAYLQTRPDPTPMESSLDDDNGTTPYPIKQRLHDIIASFDNPTASRLLTSANVLLDEENVNKPKVESENTKKSPQEDLFQSITSNYVFETEEDLLQYIQYLREEDWNRKKDYLASDAPLSTLSSPSSSSTTTATTPPSKKKDKAPTKQSKEQKQEPVASNVSSSDSDRRSKVRRELERYRPKPKSHERRATVNSVQKKRKHVGPVITPVPEVFPDKDKDGIFTDEEAEIDEFMDVKYLPMPGQPTKAAELTYSDLLSIIRVNSRFIDPYRIKFILEELLDPTSQKIISTSPTRILQLLEPLLILNLSSYDEQHERLVLDRLYIVQMFINHRTKHLFVPKVKNVVQPDGSIKRVVESIHDEEALLEELLDDDQLEQIDIAHQTTSKLKADMFNPMKYTAVFSDIHLLHYFLQLGIPVPTHGIINILKQIHTNSLSFATTLTSKALTPYDEQLIIYEKLRHRAISRIQSHNQYVSIRQQQEVQQGLDSASKLSDDILGITSKKKQIPSPDGYVDDPASDLPTPDTTTNSLKIPKRFAWENTLTQIDTPSKRFPTQVLDNDDGNTASDLYNDRLYFNLEHPENAAYHKFVNLQDEVMKFPEISEIFDQEDAFELFLRYETKVRELLFNHVVDGPQKDKRSEILRLFVDAHSPEQLNHQTTILQKPILDALAMTLIFPFFAILHDRFMFELKTDVVEQQIQEQLRAKKTEYQRKVELIDGNQWFQEFQQLYPATPPQDVQSSAHRSREVDQPSTSSSSSPHIHLSPEMQLLDRYNEDQLANMKSYEPHAHRTPIDMVSDPEIDDFYFDLSSGNEQDHDAHHAPSPSRKRPASPLPPIAATPSPAVPHSDAEQLMSSLLVDEYNPLAPTSEKQYAPTRPGVDNDMRTSDSHTQAIQADATTSDHDDDNILAVRKKMSVSTHQFLHPSTVQDGNISSQDVSSTDDQTDPEIAQTLKERTTWDPEVRYRAPIAEEHEYIEVGDFTPFYTDTEHQEDWENKQSWHDLNLQPEAPEKDLFDTDNEQFFYGMKLPSALKQQQDKLLQKVNSPDTDILRTLTTPGPEKESFQQLLKKTRSKEKRALFWKLSLQKKAYNESINRVAMSNDPLYQSLARKPPSEQSPIGSIPHIDQGFSDIEISARPTLDNHPIANDKQMMTYEALEDGKRILKKIPIVDTPAVTAALYAHPHQSSIQILQDSFQTDDLQQHMDRQASIGSKYVHGMHFTPPASSMYVHHNTRQRKQQHNDETTSTTTSRSVIDIYPDDHQQEQQQSPSQNNLIITETKQKGIPPPQLTSMSDHVLYAPSFQSRKDLDLKQRRQAVVDYIDMQKRDPTMEHKRNIIYTTSMLQDMGMMEMPPETYKFHKEHNFSTVQFLEYKEPTSNTDDSAQQETKHDADPRSSQADIEQNQTFKKVVSTLKLDKNPLFNQFMEDFQRTEQQNISKESEKATAQSETPEEPPRVKFSWSKLHRHQKKQEKKTPQFTVLPSYVTKVLDHFLHPERISSPDSFLELPLTVDSLPANISKNDFAKAFDYAFKTYFDRIQAISLAHYDYEQYYQQSLRIQHWLSHSTIALDDQDPSFVTIVSKIPNKSYPEKPIESKTTVLFTDLQLLLPPPGGFLSSPVAADILSQRILDRIAPAQAFTDAAEQYVDSNGTMFFTPDQVLILERIQDISEVLFERYQQQHSAVDDSGVKNTMGEVYDAIDKIESMHDSLFQMATTQGSSDSSAQDEETLASIRVIQDVLKRAKDEIQQIFDASVDHTDEHSNGTDSSPSPSLPLEQQKLVDVLAEFSARQQLSGILSEQLGTQIDLNAKHFQRQFAEVLQSPSNPADASHDKHSNIISMYETLAKQTGDDRLTTTFRDLNALAPLMKHVLQNNAASAGADHDHVPTVYDSSLVLGFILNYLSPSHRQKVMDQAQSNHQQQGQQQHISSSTNPELIQSLSMQFNSYMQQQQFFKRDSQRVIESDVGSTLKTFLRGTDTYLWLSLFSPQQIPHYINNHLKILEHVLNKPFTALSEPELDVNDSKEVSPEDSAQLKFNIDDVPDLLLFPHEQSNDGDKHQQNDNALTIAASQPFKPFFSQMSTDLKQFSLDLHTVTHILPFISLTISEKDEIMTVINTASAFKAKRMIFEYHLLFNQLCKEHNIDPLGLLSPAALFSSPIFGQTPDQPQTLPIRRTLASTTKLHEDNFIALAYARRLQIDDEIATLRHELNAIMTTTAITSDEDEDHHHHGDDNHQRREELSHRITVLQDELHRIRSNDEVWWDNHLETYANHVEQQREQLPPPIQSLLMIITAAEAYYMKNHLAYDDTSATYKDPIPNIDAFAVLPPEHSFVDDNTLPMASLYSPWQQQLKHRALFDKYNPLVYLRDRELTALTQLENVAKRMELLKAHDGQTLSPEIQSYLLGDAEGLSTDQLYSLRELSEKNRAYLNSSALKTDQNKVPDYSKETMDVGILTETYNPPTLQEFRDQIDRLRAQRRRHRQDKSRSEMNGEVIGQNSAITTTPAYRDTLQGTSLDELYTFYNVAMFDFFKIGSELRHHFRTSYMFSLSLHDQYTTLSTLYSLYEVDKLLPKAPLLVEHKTPSPLSSSSSPSEHIPTPPASDESSNDQRRPQLSQTSGDSQIYSKVHSSHPTEATHSTHQESGHPSHGVTSTPTADSHSKERFTKQQPLPHVEKKLHVTATTSLSSPQDERIETLDGLEPRVITGDQYSSKDQSVHPPKHDEQGHEVIGSIDDFFAQLETPSDVKPVSSQAPTRVDVPEPELVQTAESPQGPLFVELKSRQDPVYAEVDDPASKAAVPPAQKEKVVSLQEQQAKIALQQEIILKRHQTARPHHGERTKPSASGQQQQHATGEMDVWKDAVSQLELLSQTSLEKEEEHRHNNQSVDKTTSDLLTEMVGDHDIIPLYSSMKPTIGSGDFSDYHSDWDFDAWIELEHQRKQLKAQQRRQLERLNAVPSEEDIKRMAEEDRKKHYELLETDRFYKLEHDTKNVKYLLDQQKTPTVQTLLLEAGHSDILAALSDGDSTDHADDGSGSDTERPRGSKAAHTKPIALPAGSIPPLQETPEPSTTIPALTDGDGEEEDANSSDTSFTPYINRYPSSNERRLIEQQKAKTNQKVHDSVVIGALKLQEYVDALSETSLNIKVRNIETHNMLPYHPQKVLTKLIDRAHTIQGNPLLLINFRQMIERCLHDIKANNSDTIHLTLPDHERKARQGTKTITTTRGQKIVNDIALLLIDEIEQFRVTDIHIYDIILHHVDFITPEYVMEIEDIFTKIMIKETLFHRRQIDEHGNEVGSREYNLNRTMDRQRDARYRHLRREQEYHTSNRAQQAHDAEAQEAAAAAAEAKKDGKGDQSGDESSAWFHFSSDDEDQPQKVKSSSSKKSPHPAAQKISELDQRQHERLKRMEKYTQDTSNLKKSQWKPTGEKRQPKKKSKSHKDGTSDNDDDDHDDDSDAQPTDSDQSSEKTNTDSDEASNRLGDLFEHVKNHPSRSHFEFKHRDYMKMTTRIINPDIAYITKLTLLCDIFSILYNIAMKDDRFEANWNGKKMNFFISTPSLQFFDYAGAHHKGNAYGPFPSQSDPTRDIILPADMDKFLVSMESDHEPIRLYSDEESMKLHENEYKLYQQKKMAADKMSHIKERFMSIREERNQRNHEKRVALSQDKSPSSRFNRNEIMFDDESDPETSRSPARSTRQAVSDDDDDEQGRPIFDNSDQERAHAEQEYYTILDSVLVDSENQNMDEYRKLTDEQQQYYHRLMAQHVQFKPFTERQDTLKRAKWVQKYHYEQALKQQQQEQEQDNHFRATLASDNIKDAIYTEARTASQTIIVPPHTETRHSTSTSIKTEDDDSLFSQPSEIFTTAKKIASPQPIKSESESEAQIRFDKNIDLQQSTSGVNSTSGNVYSQHQHQHPHHHQMKPSTNRATSQSPFARSPRARAHAHVADDDATGVDFNDIVKHDSFGDVMNHSLNNNSTKKRSKSIQDIHPHEYEGKLWGDHDHTADENDIDHGASMNKESYYPDFVGTDATSDKAAPLTTAQMLLLKPNTDFKRELEFRKQQIEMHKTRLAREVHNTRLTSQIDDGNYHSMEQSHHPTAPTSSPGLGIHGHSFSALSSFDSKMDLLKQQQDEQQKIHQEAMAYHAKQRARGVVNASSSSSSSSIRPPTATRTDHDHPDDGFERFDDPFLLDKIELQRQKNSTKTSSSQPQHGKSPSSSSHHPMKQKEKPFQHKNSRQHPSLRRTKTNNNSSQTPHPAQKFHGGGKRTL